MLNVTEAMLNVAKAILDVRETMLNIAKAMLKCYRGYDLQSTISRDAITSKNVTLVHLFSRPGNFDP